MIYAVAIALYICRATFELSTTNCADKRILVSLSQSARLKTGYTPLNELIYLET